ncbi:MAG: PepSY domain-containing protein [Alphaproteobacteria bacterium]
MALALIRFLRIVAVAAALITSHLGQFTASWADDGGHDDGGHDDGGGADSGNDDGGADHGDDDGGGPGAGGGGEPREPEDDDARDAANAVAQGWVLPLDRVLPTVADAVEGEVLDVDLSHTLLGGWRYKVVVLTRQGQYREVTVDAQRNQILRIRNR